MKGNAPQARPYSSKLNSAGRDFIRERGSSSEAIEEAVADACGIEYKPYEERLMTKAGCVNLIREKLAVAYVESAQGTVESLRSAEHLRKMIDSTKEYMALLEAGAEEKMGELENKIALVVAECTNLREERDNLAEVVKELERRVGVQTAAGVDGIEQEAT